MAVVLPKYPPKSQVISLHDSPRLESTDPQVISSYQHPLRSKTHCTSCHLIPWSLWFWCRIIIQLDFGIQPTIDWRHSFIGSSGCTWTGCWNCWRIRLAHWICEMVQLYLIDICRQLLSTSKDEMDLRHFDSSVTAFICRLSKTIHLSLGASMTTSCFCDLTSNFDSLLHQVDNKRNLRYKVRSWLALHED